MYFVMMAGADLDLPRLELAAGAIVGGNSD
jgi:hypothetical protein